jgi:hypothetical protein
MSGDSIMVAEFRIATDDMARRREFKNQMLSWGTVVLLLLATAVLFTLGMFGLLRGYLILRLLFIFTLLGTIVSAIVLASREALRRAEREMIFALDESAIVRKRKGWPDIRIAFSEVDAIRAELRWLVVYSTEPRRKIAIPMDVKDFEVIRAELLRHHSLSDTSSPRWSGFALPVISVLSWAALLFIRDFWITLAAGSLALVALAIGSRQLWNLLSRSSRRLLMWICLGSAWIVAILVICIRVMRS